LSSFFFFYSVVVWLFLSNDQRQFNWHWIHCRLSFSHLSKLIITL
jgi:hypothetical protein